MRQSPWNYTAEFRLVFHLSELRAPHDGVDIVVIPGLWAEHAPDNVSRRCSWLKLLVASTDNDTRVFIFKYDIVPSDDGSVWHQMLGLGRVLLDDLRQARPFESQRRPLHFICHSLGGILLKQALLIAQYDYPAIRNAVSGIIFLSSPHLTTADDARWELWKLILRLFRKDVPKNVLREKDTKMLANVCDKFTARGSVARDCQGGERRVIWF
ncbi:hypothetical protein GGR55DRAFT_105033 [Xylaria sp. FL0064]|nr:hypothetical protein GGR55DRAFT_105033 [Xylaria sp. FL0064]